MQNEVFSKIQSDQSYPTEKTPLLKCAECDKGFDTPYHLKRHDDAVHKKIRKYECKTCRKTFPYKWNLNAHLDRKVKPCKPSYGYGEEIPTFKPTLEEFKTFKTYVEIVGEKVKNIGIAKIIMPPEHQPTIHDWKEEDLYRDFHRMKIDEPKKQIYKSVFGANGM